MRVDVSAPGSGTGGDRRGPIRRVRDATDDRLLSLRRIDIVQRPMARPVPVVRTKRDFDVVAVSDPASPHVAALLAAGRTGAPENLASGDVGFVAFDGGILAGWIWFTRRSHVDPYGGIRMNLQPHEGYTYDLYADPRYRPDGVAALLVQAMLRHVAEHHDDVEVVYSYVRESNRESQVLLRMMFGFTSCQKATSVRVLNHFGCQMPFRTTPSGGPSSRRRNR